MGIVFLFPEEVGDGSTIGYNDTFKAPVIAEYLCQQPVAAAARITFKAVVCAHYLFDIGFLYQYFECRQIGFP